MHPIALTLFWHQHQPYYPDDVSGQTLMPWVRLHGTKDYIGMALHLKEVPEFRCTINLVPSLLLQLQRYTEQGLSDRHLDMSRMPADGLSKEDAKYLLEQFFLCAPGMIQPYPRYHELHQKRGMEPLEKVAARFTAQEFRDLQVWNNLTWIHPLVFEQDAQLRELRKKGRDFTEAEKRFLLDEQMRLLKRVIPLHRELAESGQVELTTTPYFHPILPLLWDKRSARQAMPECALPRYLDPYTQDARAHLQRAVEYHAKLFGASPVGMWPSEGSVSQEIIPAVASVGIEWIATDEEILAQSTNGWISRDAQGYIRHPEMLYRPWRLEEQGRQLQIVFRDHGLSDLIGFHYQRGDQAKCAHDLIGRCEAIARAVEGNNAGRMGVVPIILDGENCWEYYPDGGVEFLRTLYRTAAKHQWVRPMRIRDYLKEHPATDRIGKLFAGSWISHNFAIWVGHQEDNTAWDLLHQTRLFLLQTQSLGQVGETDLKRAWEELYIAEGSDWYWWFGDDHSCAQDGLFDQLFRKHLQNVYTCLGAPCPTVLNRPIASLQPKSIHTDPKAFLKVKVDGRRSFFEWINAGVYVAGSERGTMTLVTEGILKAIHFGFDAERMMIRLDTSRFAKTDLAEVDELRVGFLEPIGYDIRIRKPVGGACETVLYRLKKSIPTRLQFAVDQIAELNVPFSDLGLEPDRPVHFFVEVIKNGQSADRAPREGAIEFRVPSPDFERIMWQ